MALVDEVDGRPFRQDAIRSLEVVLFVDAAGSQRRTHEL